MSKPIKVLQVMGSLNRGGAESMVMNLYRFIDQRVVQFDFVTHGEPDGAFVDEIREKGGKIYSCPRYIGINHLIYSKWWKHFFDVHREYRIVHSHVRSTALIIFRKAKRHNVIRIIHSHSTSNGKGVKSLLKRLLQYPLRFEANYYFGCSKEAALWLFGDRIVNGSNYHMVKNSIDTSLYTFHNDVKKEYREKLGIRQDSKVLIHVGRFHESKNHGFIIDIAYQLTKNNVKFQLLLVGDGELRKSIEEKVKKLNLGNLVMFLGVRDDVPNLLKMADAFIFPSLWEGLPVSVVEAQAAGLPCFISDRITRDVYITDLIHYLPVEDGVMKWVKEIKKGLKEDKKDRRTEIIKAGFDISESAEWLVQFYRQITKGADKNER